MKNKQIDCILTVLRQAGLKPYIHAKAVSGSVYIKFKVPLAGALRISDHKQRNRYHYKWNLRKDVEEIKTKLSPHICYYYPFTEFETMVRDMIDACNFRLAFNWDG